MKADEPIAAVHVLAGLHANRLFAYGATDLAGGLLGVAHINTVAGTVAALRVVGVVGQHLVSPG